MGACMRMIWPGPSLVGLLTGLAVLVAAGCRSSPWSSGPQADRPIPQNASSSQAGPAAQSSQNAPSTSQPGGPGAESASGQGPGQPPAIPTVEELLDQIAQVEQLEPAVRQRLEADLRQTDPALWPAVVQSFRAALAYRRQREERLRQTPAGAQPASAVSIAEAHSAPAAGPAVQPQKTASDPNKQEPAAGRLADSSQRPAADPPGSDVSPQAQSLEGGPPPADSQAAGQRGPATAGGTAQGTASAGSAKGTGSQVEPAGYTEGPAPWQQHVAAALAALEAEIRDAPASPEVADKHARLRLLALVAGQREEALRPLPAVPQAVQDFWRQELYGLAVWLDSQRQEDPVRRAGEARQQLASALVPLGWVAPLVLRNLAFITQVQSYGDYKPFARYEFAPEQEVLLYVEIENFASEETPKGYHTVLEASYRIFDSRNQQVAEKQLGTTEEFCRNPRRDFFVVYHLRMPKRIYAGRHTLQLTVVDQKSKKVGQASIEFTIQEPTP